MADDENERPRKQVVEVWRGSKGFKGVCVCLRERERKRERDTLLVRVGESTKREFHAENL